MAMLCSPTVTTVTILQARLMPISSRLVFQELATAAPPLSDSTNSVPWTDLSTILAPSDASLCNCYSCSAPSIRREHIQSSVSRLAPFSGDGENKSSPSYPYQLDHHSDGQHIPSGPKPAVARLMIKGTILQLRNNGIAPPMQIESHAFTYECVYHCSKSPSTIYDDRVALQVDALFHGYNATVPAFGRTGSAQVPSRLRSTTGVEIDNQECRTYDALDSASASRTCLFCAAPSPSPSLFASSSSVNGLQSLPCTVSSPKLFASDPDQLEPKPRESFNGLNSLPCSDPDQLKTAKEDIKKILKTKCNHPILIRLGWPDDGAYNKNIEEYAAYQETFFQDYAEAHATRKAGISRTHAEKPLYSDEAEVSRLMDLIVNSVYSKKEVFLRELISNASDALDKLQFLSITEPELLKDAVEFDVRIQADKDNGIITITDTGLFESLQRIGRAAYLASRNEQSVIKCVEDYKREDQFHPENRETRLAQLKKVKIEKKKLVAVPANKRMRASKHACVPSFLAAPNICQVSISWAISSFSSTLPLFTLLLFLHLRPNLLLNSCYC